jgi:putative transposase
VAARVSPTEAIRAEIHELFASEGELLSVLEQVARLSVRLTFQSVVEEIVCEELGRDRYQRRTGDSPEGYRNGWHQPRTLKTAAGPVPLQRPKLRHAHAALCDQLFGQGVTRTNALETLVISCWVRGLSDRDVEAMLVEVFGEQATISRTTVSRICQRLRAEFDTWRRRDLSAAEIDYLYLDGSFLQDAPQGQGRAGAGRLGHRHRRTRGVPRPWAPGRPSRPTPGEASSRTWPTGGLAPAAGHLRRRQGPGRGDRVLVPQQPAPTLSGPCLPQPHRQGPTHAQDQVKRDYWAIFDIIEQDGQAAVAEARQRAKRFIAKWTPLYPAAVACVADNLDALTVHLLFPAEHRRRIRHSNLIERTFGETRRRVKVIGRLPGEQSYLSLVWAVLDRASKGWRGLTMTPRRCAGSRISVVSSWPSTPPRRWSTSPSYLPRNITPEPASRAVYTAPETPPPSDGSASADLE